MQKKIFIMTLLALAIAIGPVAAGASGSSDMTRDQLHQQLRDRIHSAQHLTDAERATMRDNLEASVQLGLTAPQLDAIFPGNGAGHEMSGEAMIRIQNRVMAAARDDLPIGLMVAKIHEGRTKGVADPVLERVCGRVEDNLRAAHRVMEHAREMGFEHRDDAAHERRMERDMAQQMWRGMHEKDYDPLFDRARQRLHDGHCDIEDVVSAGEIATRLHGQGVDHDRALRVSGEALEKGYRSHDMRYLQFMVTARRHAGPTDDFVGDLEYCLSMGMGLDQMYRHMMQSGWMGPGDMWGPGGYHPIDDMGHGPGHDGMMDGDHDGGGHDGMGDDGHGGMDGGHNGGM